jgi:glycosyltransferase involved in cell wall biosynthesis
MKLLTIAVPCYNSEAYMRNCIESLLPGGEEVEIIIVDDGSTKDRTPEIADEYAAKYPSIVKVVHKPNGGHGSAVNTGIEHATGLYFKVVDSDDWLDQEAYPQVLSKLRELAAKEPVLDMFICNYLYDHEGEEKKAVIHYRHSLPKGRVFTWNDCHHFRKGHYILMHSVIFRTQLLKDCGVKLPEHTFYVDSIYVYEPLMHVKNLYYMDVNLYHYYIGRADQSVNEKVMIARMDQQIKVNTIMLDFLIANKKEIQKCKRLYQYMENYLEIITVVTSVLSLISNTPEHLEGKRKVWQYIKEQDRALWWNLRFGIMGIGMNIPGRFGRWFSVSAYKLCKKIFKFN